MAYNTMKIYFLFKSHHSPMWVDEGSVPYSVSGTHHASILMSPPAPSFFFYCILCIQSLAKRGEKNGEDHAGRFSGARFEVPYVIPTELLWPEFNPRSYPTARKSEIHNSSCVPGEKGTGFREHIASSLPLPII